MKIKYYADKMYTSDVGSPEPPGSGSPHPGKSGSSSVLGIIILAVLIGVACYVALRSSKENKSKSTA